MQCHRSFGTVAVDHTNHPAPRANHDPHMGGRSDTLMKHDQIPRSRRVTASTAIESPLLAIPIGHAAAADLGTCDLLGDACMPQTPGNKRRTPGIAIAHTIALTVIQLAVDAIILGKIARATLVGAGKIGVAVPLVIAQLTEGKCQNIIPTVTRQRHFGQRRVIRRAQIFVTCFVNRLHRRGRQQKHRQYPPHSQRPKALFHSRSPSL